MWQLARNKWRALHNSQQIQISQTNCNLESTALGERATCICLMSCLGVQHLAPLRASCLMPRPRAAHNFHLQNCASLDASPRYLCETMATQFASQLLNPTKCSRSAQTAMSWRAVWQDPGIKGTIRNRTFMNLWQRDLHHTLSPPPPSHPPRPDHGHGLGEVLAKLIQGLGAKPVAEALVPQSTFCLASEASWPTSVQTVFPQIPSKHAR